jgi:hypothetical protein
MVLTWLKVGGTQRELRLRFGGGGETYIFGVLAAVVEDEENFDLGSMC